MSDSLLELCAAERDIVRAITPDLPVTTNGDRLAGGEIPVPPGVEITVRRSDGGEEFLFLLNHNVAAVDLPVPERWQNAVDLLTGAPCPPFLSLPANGVMVLRSCTS